MTTSRPSLLTITVVLMCMATLVSTKLSAKTYKSLQTLRSEAVDINNQFDSQTNETQVQQEKYTEYDTLVIASEWVGSVCQLKKCNEGRPVNNNFFNIHGLWPNVRDDFKKTPFDCKNTTVSIASLPMDVQTALNYYWNPLYSKPEEFLNHEWTKHGTCWNPAPLDFEAVPSDLKKVVAQAQGCMSDDFNHQINYIKTTVSLAQKYNIFAALASQGILPNNQRVLQKDEFLRAILNSVKVSKFEVICQKNTSGASFLYEIRICVDKNYNPVECFDLKYNCPDQMIYPDYA